MFIDQLRIHSTRDTDFYIHVTAKAVIEDSQELRYLYLYIYIYLSIYLFSIHFGFFNYLYIYIYVAIYIIYTDFYIHVNAKAVIEDSQELSYLYLSIHISIYLSILYTPTSTFTGMPRL